MPYTVGQATPRADIHALVMQATADFQSLCIGDKIFPVVGEDVRRGVYMRAKLANAQLLNVDSAPREQGATYQRVNRKYDTDTFDCQEYGLEAVIDDSYEEEVSRFFDLEVAEAMLLDRNLRIGYEARIAAALFNTTTFSYTTGTVAYTAGATTTADPVNDINIAKGEMLKNGIIPNAVVMSYPVFQRIRTFTLLQNQIFGVVPRAAGQRLLPDAEDVARALGVDQLLIGSCPKNANQMGQTYSGGFVWSDTYIAVCEIKAGMYQAGGVGRTIQWTKDTTGLFTPETYRSEERRSNVLRVRQNTAEKVIDETACRLIVTQYS